MTVEFWQKAERFYEFWLMNIFSLIVLTLIIMIFSYTYAAKGNRQKPLTILLGFVALLALIGGIGHVYYHEYIGQAMHVNPLMRDRTPAYFGYLPYGASEEMYYAELNDLDALREMTIYDEIRIEEPLTYLGTNGYSHYFVRENGDQFRHTQRVLYHNEAEKPLLVGSRFVLKDQAFSEIGFKDPEHVMFAGIILPVSEEGKNYKPEFETDFYRAERVVHDWNF